MNSRKKIDFLCVAVFGILTFGVGVAQAVEVPFFERLISTNFNNPQTAYPEDIDGDGDIDVVVASRIGGKVSWFENSGGAPPVFTERFVGTSNDARGVFAADVDGDGYTDIISTAAIGGREVVWWENNGALPPVFTKHPIPATGIDWFPVFAADVDKDGDTDILAGNGPSGTAANRVVWFDNNGASPPSFTQRLISTSVNWPFAVFATDLDGDGDTDVLSASRLDDKIAWYENNGAIPPVFTQRIISINANDAQHVSAADLDDDGDLDVISASGQDDKLAWYESNGGLPPLFVEHVITNTADFIRYASPSDVDRDGDVDILSAIAAFGGDGQFVWYDNEDDDLGGGVLHRTFTERTILTRPSSEPIVIVGADIDGDTDTDAFALTAAGSGRLSWFENQDPGPMVSFNTVSAPQDGYMPLETITTFPGTVGSQPIGVMLTVSGTTVINTVTVNGVPATGGPTEWSVSNVPLNPGENTITARAVTAGGRVGEASVQVGLTLDFDEDGIQNDVDRALGEMGGPRQPSSEFSDQAAVPGFNSPRAVALTPDGTRAFVTNQGSNTVVVVDTLTRDVVASIPVGNYPQGIAITPDGTRAYVATDSAVSVIDINTLEVIASVSVNGRASQIAISEERPIAYVVSAPIFSGSGWLSTIHTGTNTVVGVVGLDLRPIDVAIPSFDVHFDSFIYIVSFQDQKVLGWDVQFMEPFAEPILPLGGNPYAGAFIPTTSGYLDRFYIITNGGSNFVQFIDLNDTFFEISVFLLGNPVDLDFSPDGARLYVSSFSQRNVTVIDPALNEVITTIPGRCRAIKKQHQFETYPTTHFFSQGTLVLTKEGKLEAAELAGLIDQHFRSHP